MATPEQWLAKLAKLKSTGPALTRRIVEDNR
jgi:hypothetical protein